MSDYKKNLADLQALYEREVQKLEQQNTQLKELYGDGLIARVDMENSDKGLADARAKVEATRSQIADANKPEPVVPTAVVNPVLSDMPGARVIRESTRWSVSMETSTGWIPT